MSTEDVGREVEFPDTDIPLREDVHVLGALVGEILREQGGNELFQAVEAARMAAIRRREGQDVAGMDQGAAVEDLEKVVFGCRGDDAEALVRAFSTYFQVVNLAETVHRLRRRRDYLRGDTPQPSSLLDTVRRLKESGQNAEAAHAALAKLCLEPVFTAHPTEATRRTMLRKEQRIARRLVERMDSSITPPEDRAALGRIRAEVTAGWQTEEHPSERLTVADEREHVLFFLTEVLYRVVPPFYEAIEEAIAEVYGEDARLAMPPMPSILHFVSWVGGDMDGNPNVTATTLRATLLRHRELILKRYLGELNELYRQLSQTPERASFDAALLARIEGDARREEGIGSVPARHRDMPYRVLLTLMHRRLERTLADGDDAYLGAAELTADLRLIADSLKNHQGAHAGLFSVERMLRRVDTFGFYLATLDVRQDAEVHRRVIGQLLGEASWLEWTADERAVRLRRVLKNTEPPKAAADEEAETTLEVFRAIDESLKLYGRGAIGPYIVSMAQDVEDVLAVLVLARWAGLVDDAGRVPLDAAPLFETVPDLEASGEVMSALLADADYRAHVAQRGDRQTVMIGYSDSNKDGGLTAARWALHRGQKLLVDALAPTGVALTLFHGRGGTISRGGGKVSRALAAMPEGALGSGGLRLTEQGEIINAKYGLRGIALRTLEQMASAVVRETTLATPSPLSESQRRHWPRVMEDMAQASRDAYRGLVYETPDFYDYFRQATPIDVIELLQIGSRPASRRKQKGIGSLRAIPWVFSWMQSRHVLPGWYGLGTGLETAIERHGEDTVAEMAKSWPFLHVLLDDAEMVLAKADLRIASRYAALVEGASGEQIFGRIHEEFKRTVELILRLKGNAVLLADDPMLQRSIRLRNPYIDPMSLLQVDLLRRWRAGDCRDEDLRRALMATVNGIAQGLRNTG